MNWSSAHANLARRTDFLAQEVWSSRRVTALAPHTARRTVIESRMKSCNYKRMATWIISTISGGKNGIHRKGAMIPRSTIGRSHSPTNSIWRISVTETDRSCIEGWVNDSFLSAGGIFVMLIIGLSFSFVVTSFEFYFKAKRRRVLDGVTEPCDRDVSLLALLFRCLEIYDDQRTPQAWSSFCHLYELHFQSTHIRQGKGSQRQRRDDRRNLRRYQYQIQQPSKLPLRDKCTDRSRSTDHRSYESSISTFSVLCQIAGMNTNS